MPKFRSWNEKVSRFFYWQYGDYFSDDACKLSITCNKSFTHSIPLFNWENAEMFGQVLPEQNPAMNQKEPFIFAEGDKIAFTFHYGGSYKDSFIGVIKFNGYVFYVEDIEDSLTKFDILSVLREDNNAKIIGNIHEGETK